MADIPYLSPAATSIKLSADKSAYTASEPIKLRFTVRSLIREKYRFVVAPPVALFTLTVTAADGTVVAPDGPFRLLPADLHGRHLALNESLTLVESMSDWGYRLTRGSYHVKAVFDHLGGTVSTNAASIVVE